MQMVHCCIVAKMCKSAQQTVIDRLEQSFVAPYKQVVNNVVWIEAKPRTGYKYEDLKSSARIGGFEITSNTNKSLLN
jgi:hypothetical protein